MSGTIIEVALPTPLSRRFDYLPPDDVNHAPIGARIKVPFGRRRLVGIVTAMKSETDIPANKLKAALAVIDTEPLFSPQMLDLLQWASRYYHYPLGEVFATALPRWLRDGRPLEDVDKKRLKAAKAKPRSPEPALALNADQENAVQAITACDGFATFLLEGVTGSGKTEVYLQAIAAVLSSGKQALVLIPEISLTPQTVARFEARFDVPIVVMHSRMSDGARAVAWREAQLGEAAIVIGTRSAVFVPMPRLGLMVMDEEHDSSFVQQSGFRYSARDMGIMRAKLCGVPMVLGSATPSLNTLANVQRQRYRHLRLQTRAKAQNPVTYQLIDLRDQHLEAGLTESVLDAMDRHLQAKHQVMVFINRRGFAPTLMCHHCGWVQDCTHCDAHMTWHERVGRAICHHCGRRQRVARLCPACQQSDLATLGAGTEQIEQFLADRFPAHPVLRVDRDTTTKKDSFNAMLNQVINREVDILVGTQMLAKGHHFPDLMLVVMVNMDAGFYSADLSALEQMGQLMIQVAGRAGREHGQGEVCIQTHQPDNPLLKALLNEGYDAFAQQLLKEREAALLPPFATMARLQVEAASSAAGLQFLQAARDALVAQNVAGVQILGPMPSMMERRAGKYQHELILLSAQRTQLHVVLDQAMPAIEALRKPKGGNWSLQLVF